MRAHQLRVNLGENSYDILIRHGLLDSLGGEITGLRPGGKVLVITDCHVDPLYGGRVQASLSQAGYQVSRLALPAGETTKSFDTLPGVYRRMIAFGLTRRDLVLALGGGVVGDLGGFAAATFLRGVPFVQVPTSLLAQVDSSVGGKVAVDLPEGKNLVGSFYQPRQVFIDPDALATLPERYWRDGLGEVIKYGCILDEALFGELERLPAHEQALEGMAPIIARCVDLKRQLVEQDERDNGLRMMLNFGHTLGHAVEAVEHYQGLSHGEAVALGMRAITRLSEAQGLTRPGTAQRLEALLASQQLPLRRPGIDPRAVLAATRRDKKQLGAQLTVAVLECIGRCRLVAAPPEFFQGVEQWLA